jgi:imidazole glycerol-phosphate synthase subunit HisF
MLKKRIIPCLDIMNGRTVKGVCFEQLRDAGDPVALAKAYVLQGADELVFLDITATIENRKTLVQLVTAIAAEINIPFTVGGGITTVTDAKELVNAGADKISINSAAFKRPALIAEIASELGSQCVVVAIDTKYATGEWNVFVHGGRTATNTTTIEWALAAERMGAGEILLTSMNNDGAKNGFDIAITQHIAGSVNIPVIASGGAGTKEHFKQVFEQTKAAAALAASVFHFGEIPIPELKQYLKTAQIPVR